MRNRRAVNAPASPSRGRTARPTRLGFACGIAAYSAWGVLPIYFKQLGAVDPVAIVAQRICWSLVALLAMVAAARAWAGVRAALADRRTMLLLLASALLIGINWLLFVWAINSGHILASSLGYYLNPLANILLGRLLLRERLSRLQWAAVAIAAAGIAVLAAGALGQLWISLLLCGTFALYGFVRKVVAADALTGLAVETALLFPPALAWLVASHAPGAPPIGPTPQLSLLLALLGLVSTVPLLLFTAAARLLPLSTMGMLQFIAPTLQFVVAVFLYGEAFTRPNAIAFGAIWAAVALYVAGLAGQMRRERLGVVLPE